ncbi:MAG: AAA family ATPase [Thermoprotei archaeon]
MKKRIIAITGMPLAGKTEVSKVAERLGLSVISMGEAVRREALKRGIKFDGESIGKFMLKLREEMGPDAVAKLCSETIEEIDGNVVIVEGVRSLYEINYFRSHFGSVQIVAVHASPKIRFQRGLLRGRHDDPKTLNEFELRDLRELEVGIGSVIALADYMIINEGPLEDTIEMAEKIFIRLITEAN